MTENEQHQMFNSNMLECKVTAWMLSYARHIVELFDHGKVDKNDPKYHIYDFETAALPTRPQLRLLAYVVALVVFLVILMIFAIILTGDGGSVLPPYFEAE